MLINTIYKYRFYLLAALFVANVLVFWPGYINSDSNAQYQQAVSAQYTDHHPPIMSFLWHYLNLIYPGPALMYVLQLSLLYASMVILLVTLQHLVPMQKRSLLSLVLLLLPIYPQIFIQSVSVLKDNQYAFCFLFCSATLAYYTVIAKRPPIIVSVLLMPLLIYGAAVKYQGQFCVIILALWLGCLWCLRRGLLAKLITGLLLYVLILGSITMINHALVPQASKNYSWQFVKLYDLAAISIATNQDLIPEFNHTSSYSYEKLRTRFQYPTVDPYIYSDDNILVVTKSPEDMTILYDLWAKNVVTHPYIYMKHRLINLCYLLLSRPGYNYGLAAVDLIPKASYWHTAASYATSAIFFIFMSHLLVIILGLFYFALAIYSWKTTKAAPVLLGFSSLALLMVVLLFFMSMAGIPRYTYISILMIHAAHIFAYSCFKERNAVKFCS